MTMLRRAGLAPLWGRFEYALHLINPRRWASVHQVLADLLAGGLVVPAPSPGRRWTRQDERKTPIWSIIQPDGDIVLKVVQHELTDADLERTLAAHLEEVEDAFKRIREAMAQVLMVRGLLGTCGVAVWIGPSIDMAQGVQGILPWSTVVDRVPWIALILGTFALSLSLFLPRLLGALVRRRLGKLGPDLVAFERRCYRNPDQQEPVW